VPDDAPTIYDIASRALAAATAPDIDTESDDALALEFVERHTGLRYIAERAKWYRWTGEVWTVDTTARTYADIRAMLRAAPTTKDRSASSLRSAQRVAAVEKLARYDQRIARTFDAFDRDDWALNTPGGIVDLRTRAISPHDPEAGCTKITGAAPDGECPRWDRFLREVTADDAELIAFLRRMVGYALTGVIREHALFFLYGTGRNGKGVFINTLTKLLGDYADVASMDTFTASPTDRHPADLAKLRGARLVVAQETEEGRRWAESRIKMLTGGDPITARFMHQDFFTFAPKFKLLIAGNHKPKLVNIDEAMRSRLHLIPFTVTIPPEQRDPELETKLRAEWPGIMRWAVDGVAEYLAIGLCPPKAVTDATADYFSSQDVFADWIEECCEVGPQAWETPSRMFASWKRYAEHHNERAGQQSAFRERMEARGFAQSRGNRGRFWSGIKVRDEPTASHWMD
jgi:putative DNA primase/helicase